jgi:hypothetical protein
MGTEDQVLEGVSNTPQRLVDLFEVQGKKSFRAVEDSVFREHAMLPTWTARHGNAAYEEILIDEGIVPEHEETYINEDGTTWTKTIPTGYVTRFIWRLAAR